ncbi:MAG: hypothetical protein HZA89_10960 [Verrucomicrobia bacterium]|nr:hypothetical protein [Verrucomicrobiota bacterium]
MTKIFGYAKSLCRIAKYGLHVLSKQHTPNWQATGNSITLIKELGLTPRLFVDAGAHDSEWAQWFVKEWPGLEVISFEPNKHCKPMGTFHQMALSDEPGTGYFTNDVGGMFISGKENGYSFPIRRFDALGIAINRPAILKIDCEHYTARAMAGFGEQLKEFDVIIVEMWNYLPTWQADHGKDAVPWNNQQAEIWECALRHGFRGARVVGIEFSTNGVPHYDIAFYREKK